MILALTSATATPGRSYDMASTILQQKLAQVDGRGPGSVGGSSLPAVRVELESARARAATASGSRTCARRSPAPTSTGPRARSTGRSGAWEIRASDQILYAAEYRPLLVAWRNGAAVRLEDVADVRDSVEDLRRSGSPTASAPCWSSSSASPAPT